MKQAYTKPTLEVLGELRDVTAAAPGGPISDLTQGRMHWKQDVPRGGPHSPGEGSY